MKRIHLLIHVLLVISSQSVAQEIEYTFISKDVSNQINSIKAKNLSNNMTAFVIGSGGVQQDIEKPRRMHGVLSVLQ